MFLNSNPVLDPNSAVAKPSRLRIPLLLLESKSQKFLICSKSGEAVSIAKLKPQTAISKLDNDCNVYGTKFAF